MQLSAFAPKEFDNGQPNRIRTPRRPRRKHPMRPIVRRRCPQQLESVRAVKFPEHDEMREPLNVSKPRLKLRQNREHPIRLVLNPKPPGNLTCVLVRTNHKSNRPRRKHKGRKLHFLSASESRSDGIHKISPTPTRAFF